MIVVPEVRTWKTRGNPSILKVHSEILGGVSLHLGSSSIRSLWYRVFEVMTLSYVRLLCKRPELLSILQLWIMWLSSDQWEIMTSWAGSVLHCELATSISSTIDHLMILIIVSLGVYLVAQVFLVKIVLLLTWNGVNHFRTSVYVWICRLFKFHMIVLPRCNNGLFGIWRTDIIVLMSLRRCNSIRCRPLVLILHRIKNLWWMAWSLDCWAVTLIHKT